MEPNLLSAEHHGKLSLTRVSFLGLFGTMSTLSTAFANCPAPLTASHESSTSAGAYDSSVSLTDLVNQGQASFAGLVESPAPAFGSNATTNGVAATNANDSSFWFVNGQPNTLTYSLDISQNSKGYDLSRIQTLAGWDKASQSQANQKFELLVKKVGSSTFESLGNFTNAPFPNSDGASYYTRTVLSCGSGSLASGVEAVQFKYAVASGGGSHPGLVIREIDIEGQPIPNHPPNPTSVRFTGNQTILQGAYYGTQATTFADIDGDGFDDFIVVNNDATVVKYNNKSGGYGAHTLLYNGAYYGSQATTFADIDGDGFDDFIVVNNDATVVKYNNGSGGFGPHTLLHNGAYYGTQATTFADINGDGYDDFVVVNADATVVKYNNRNGGFSAHTLLYPDAYYGTKATTFADLNGDGFDDFIAVNTDDSWVMMNNRSGGFEPREGPLLPRYFGSRATTFANINGDRFADFVVVNETSTTTRNVVASGNTAFSGNTANTATPKWGQVIYLKAHCTGVHCPGTNGKYLHSNSPEGAGTSWGSKRAEYTWRVGGAAELVNNGKFSLVAHCTGDFDCETHNMALTSLGQEGSYSSWSPFDDSPDTPWIIEYDPPLRSGSIVHLKGQAGRGQAGKYLHSNSPEGAGASWGSKDHRYAWTIEYSEGIASGKKMSIEGVEYTRRELKTELGRQGMTLVEPENGVLKVAANQCGIAWPEPPSGEVSGTSASASTNVGLLNCAYEVTDGVELKVKGVYGGCSGQTGINGADTAHKGSCEFTTISAAVEVDMGGGVSNTYEVKGPNASACGGATITSACAGASAELVGTSTYMKDSNGNGAGVGAGIGVGFNNKGSVDSDRVNVEFDVKAGIGFSVKLDWNYAQTGEAIYKVGTDTVMTVNDTVAVVGERVSDAASQAVSDPGAFIVGSPEMVYATAMEAGEATLHFAEDMGQRIEDIGTKIGGAAEFIGNRWVNTGEAIGSGIESAAEEVGNALNPGNWF